jgi:hypothetical protein
LARQEGGSEAAAYPYNPFSIDNSTLVSKTLARSPTTLYLLARLTRRRILGDNPGLIP